MKIRPASLFYVTVLSFSVLLPHAALAETENYNNGFKKDQLTEYLDALEKANKAMLTVSVSHKGHLIYDKQTGFSEIKTSWFSKDKWLPVNSDTQYRVASITKMFTSVLLHQLIEDGKLSYQTPLAKFYPKLPNANKITIEHLLNHSSGLFNYVGDHQLSPVVYQDHSKQALLDLFSSYSPEFEPGSTHKYSNTGYITLGFIIEEVTGQSFESLIKQRIAEPIGLKNTWYCRDQNLCGPQSKSYTYFNGQWHPAKEWGQLTMFSTGGILSTSRDLVKFMDALFSHQLINQQSLQSMLEMKHTANINQEWGKGIFPMHFLNHQGYFHNGYVEAYRSWAGHFPDESVSIAISSNALHEDFETIRDNILGLYFDTPVDIADFERPSITIPQEEFAHYIGEYRSYSTSATVRIYEEEGKLMFDASDMAPSKLTAYSETEFDNRHVGYSIEFSGYNKSTDKYALFSYQFGSYRDSLFRR